MSIALHESWTDFYIIKHYNEEKTAFTAVGTIQWLCCALEMLSLSQTVNGENLWKGYAVLVLSSTILYVSFLLVERHWKLIVYNLIV